MTPHRADLGIVNKMIVRKLAADINRKFVVGILHDENFLVVMNMGSINILHPPM